ncbi:MAG: hypothetical protein JWO35_90 [Candidatus Saccharibacteria bacterium]|nr:hypothetical protein [Candidatus Saccharibacteria bacterium]
MGKNNNTIHINGKRYDARTGALLVQTTSVEPIKKPTMHDVVRHPAKHAPSHKPQNSQTLMRHVVKKPSGSLKRHTKAQSGNGKTAVVKQATASVITKASVHKLDDIRLKHAQKVTKSKLVSRFVPVTVDDAAAHHIKHGVKHAAPAHYAKPIVASHAPLIREKTTADLLQQALQHATSHEQTYKPKKRFSTSKRITGVSAAVATLVVVVGLVASQSYTSVRLHVASSKAGFDVSAPSYQPAGYSLGHVTYSAGNAGLHFTSNSDDRAFSITEKTSRWDSSTLRDLVVAPAGNDYQTIESAGRTIFLDSNSNASWVNGGILYQVKAEGVLNEQQLVKIANSL